MRRTIALLTLIALVAAGCSDDNNGAPQTSCQQVEDTTGTLYELLDDSILLSRTEQSSSELNTESLSGTFRLKPFPPGPNVELAFELRAVRLCGGTDVIESVADENGTLGFFGTPGDIIPGSFHGTVNGGEPMLFEGHGPYHLDSNGAVVLDGVVFCAPELPPLRCEDFPSRSEAGYYLKVFAAPAGQ